MEIIDFKPEHIENFINFTNDNEGDLNFFYPHKMDGASLYNMLIYKKSDQYKIMVHDHRIIGYGLLRGWDEGYEIPSLGIIIDRNFRGLGLSKTFMMFLESTAKIKGATQMRLVVNKLNKVAIDVYLKLGYTLSEHNEHQLIGIKSI